MDREKIKKGFERCLSGKMPFGCGKCPYFGDEEYTDAWSCRLSLMRDALELLKEQDELLKHEYWRGYNNGRADERGLQEGTIMQTFSPD